MHPCTGIAVIWPLHSVSVTPAMQHKLRPTLAAARWLRMVGGSCRWSPARTPRGALSSAAHVAGSSACNRRSLDLSRKQLHGTVAGWGLAGYKAACCTVPVAATMTMADRLPQCPPGTHHAPLKVQDAVVLQRRPCLGSLVHDGQVKGEGLQVAGQAPGEGGAHHLGARQALPHSLLLPAALLLGQQPQLPPQCPALRIVLQPQWG